MFIPPQPFLCEVQAAGGWMDCVCVCVFHPKKKTVNRGIIYCETDSSQAKGPAYIFCRNKDNLIYSPIILISLPERHFL